MHCRDAEALLDRRIDADLAPEEVEGLSAHVAGCTACARAAQQEAAERRIFERLRAALDAQPPIWPAVREAIQTHAAPKSGLGRSGRTALWVGAPALAASLVLGLILARPDQSANQATTSPEAATLEAQARYLRAIETVRLDVLARLAQLPPATTDSLSASLAELDATIAAASAAWRIDPDDPLATRYLLSAYAHKLELLTRFVAVS